jgi:hypothetical protein
MVERFPEKPRECTGGLTKNYNLSTTANPLRLQRRVNEFLGRGYPSHWAVAVGERFGHGTIAEMNRLLRHSTGPTLRLMNLHWTKVCDHQNADLGVSYNSLHYGPSKVSLRGDSHATDDARASPPAGEQGG